MSEALQTPKLADAIAAHVERLILEGLLRPGEKLASERELADKFDVSRPSLCRIITSRQWTVLKSAGSNVAIFALLLLLG